MKGIRSSQAIVALFVMLLAAGGASASDVWNAANDFDLVHNPAELYPWSYGAGTGSQFRLATVPRSYGGLAGWEANPNHYPDVRKNVTGAPFIWNPIGEKGLVPKDALTMTPSYTTAETGTVRWTAPFTGQFQVDCDFTGVYEYTGTEYPHGTNADVLIFVDGVSAFDQNIQFYGTTGFHDTFSLAGGSTIDFAVNYGPDATGSWDRVILDATIIKVPEPATLSLLALGGLALIRRGKRARRRPPGARTVTERTVARSLTIPVLFVLGILTVGTAEAQDYLYICQQQENIVSKYTTSGETVNDSLITGLYIPTDLILDENGNLLVLENSNRRIGLYTTSGEVIDASFISTPFYPHNFALDGDGNIYVTGGGSFGAPSRIAKYTTSGTVVSHSFITTGLSNPAGIACDMNGNLFVANSGNGTIAQFTTSGALVNGALVSGLGYPVDLVYDGAGHLFLADQERGVQEYTTSGELVAADLTPGFYGSCSIALDGRGNLFAGGPNASYPVPIGQFTISGEVVNPALITGVRTPHGLVVERVPEPASLALLALGSLGLLRRRRRR